MNRGWMRYRTRNVLNTNRIVPVVIRGKPRRVRQVVEWRGVVWVTLEPSKETK